MEPIALTEEQLIALGEAVREIDPRLKFEPSGDAWVLTVTVKLD